MGQLPEQQVSARSADGPSAVAVARLLDVVAEYEVLLAELRARTDRVRSCAGEGDTAALERALAEREGAMAALRAFEGFQQAARSRAAHSLDVDENMVTLDFLAAHGPRAYRAEFAAFAERFADHLDHIERVAGEAQRIAQDALQLLRSSVEEQFGEAQLRTYGPSGQPRDHAREHTRAGRL